MGLPGAVEQMSVGTMTVTNLEGLTTLVGPDEDMGTATAIENMTSQMTEQQRILLNAITAFRERAGGVGAPEPDWDRWAQALSGAITSFRERAGGVGMPEPDWSAMDLQQLLGEISLAPSEITASSLEIQSPSTDMLSPMTRITSVSSDMTTATVDMMAGNVSLLAQGLSGLPDTDMAGVELILSSIYTVNTMILAAIQSQPLGGYPVVPPIATGVELASIGGPSPEQLRRFVDNRNYWSFRNQSRVKTAF